MCAGTRRAEFVTGKRRSSHTIFSQILLTEAVSSSILKQLYFVKYVFFKHIIERVYHQWQLPFVLTSLKSVSVPRFMVSVPA